MREKQSGKYARAFFKTEGYFFGEKGGNDTVKLTAPKSKNYGKYRGSDPR